jgi:hypothetical protein
MGRLFALRRCSSVSRTGGMVETDTAEATPIIHAAALKPWGNRPWAWPRDGRRETLEGAGIALAKMPLGTPIRNPITARQTW